MPELPDVTVYVEALTPRVAGRTLTRATVRGPLLLRTVDPGPESCVGRRVEGVERLGKRVVLLLEGGACIALHLMIAGRLLWKPPGVGPTGRIDLAALGFDPPSPDGGTLILTEAGTAKRAAMHVLASRGGLRALAPEGVEPLACTPAQFAAALARENRTLKRALTSPRLFSGIGNAYSDEILHAARLSPVKLTSSLSPEEAERLHLAARRTLTEWTDALRREFGLVAGSPGRFPGPGAITAFRPGFAVHGRFGLPCPACATPVQRIVRASNEVNYCPGCQTGGRLLADRSLSRLLKDDWPQTVEGWDQAT